MLHALSAWRKTPIATPDRRNAWPTTTSGRIASSSPRTARALLALTAHRCGDAERARVLVRNLEDGVKVDATPDQSVLLKGGDRPRDDGHRALGRASGFWWRWYEGPVETTAFVLRALVTIDPKHAWSSRR